MTVYEFRQLLLAERDRAVVDATRDRAVAWMSAALARTKRLPRFDSFVNPKPQQQRPLTESEIAERNADIDELAASSGLTVWRPEESDDDGEG